MKYKPRAEIRDGKKQCRKCLEWIDTSLFGTFLEKSNKVPTRYINSRCKKCSVNIAREWALSHPEETRLKYDILNKKIQDNRDIIYKAYGNKCNCCGETNKLFLTIDHVNNDGYKNRPYNKGKGRATNLYSGHYYIQIIKANFPNDLQLLCWNCNCGKARNNGVCPHKTIC